MDDRPSRTTTIPNIKAADLPDEWRARSGLSGSERVDVVIRSTMREDLVVLKAIAAEASARARAKGLTAKKLAAVLKEAKAARRR